ncbi:MAG: hypothetical protein ABW194_04835, partial [Novosphingobium sp.]
DEFAGQLRRELGIGPLAETCALRDCLLGDDALVRRFAAGAAFPNFATPVAAQPGVDELLGAIEQSRGLLPLA